MGKGFKKGATMTPFNFELVIGETAPENPKENTIWVNTSVKITGWAFDHTAPENPVQGMVWFETLSNVTCAAGFNALKKNTLGVYPTSCHQYVDGAWVKKAATTYKNGEWIDWQLWIFQSGVGLHPTITGFTNVTCTNELISGTLSDSNDMVSNETIDVTPYSTAHFDGVYCRCSCGEANSSGLYLKVGESSTTVGSSYTNGSVTYCDGKDFTVDISGETGEVTFGAQAYSNGGATFDFSVLNIWFE